MNNRTLVQNVEYQRLFHLRQQHLQISDCLNHQLNDMRKEAQKAHVTVDATQSEMRKIAPKRQLDQQPRSTRNVGDNSMEQESNSVMSKTVPTIREEQIAQVVAQQFMAAIPIIVEQLS